MHISDHVETTKKALNDFIHDVLPAKERKKDTEADEKPAHDLGHASKCIWELDKEA